MYQSPKGTIFEAQDASVKDSSRLTGQNAAILSRLTRGPVTNAELSRDYSLKYTSRLSDLRAAGYAIKCERLNGGITRYTLEAKP
jgi:hypothetical protein